MRFIEKGGFVFGVEVNDDLEIQHSSADNKRDLEKFMGSKYVQSRVGNSYIDVKTALDNGRWVLFSGTPCQVEGLLKYLNNTNTSRLITVDVFCHGVGSPGFWKYYIEHNQKKYHSRISRVYFREKTYGYNSACLALYFENGKVSRKDHDNDQFWSAFSKCFIFRPSCYQCQFKKCSHLSDFTIGDYWETTNLPESYARANGCSLLLLHSDKAKEVLASIDDMIEKTAVDPFDALLVNGGHQTSMLITSSYKPPERDDFFEYTNNYGIEYAVKKYLPTSLPQKAKLMLKPLLHRLGILQFIKKMNTRFHSR